LKKIILLSLWIGVFALINDFVRNFKHVLRMSLINGVIVKVEGFDDFEAPCTISGPLETIDLRVREV
jgi:hypothetical protein